MSITWQTWGKGVENIPQVIGNIHGLSQDLETGCPKLAILKFWGVQIFKGDHNILKILTINMYKFIKTRHDILIQCNENNMKEMKKIYYIYFRLTF